MQLNGITLSNEFEGTLQKTRLKHIYHSFLLKTNLIFSNQRI